MLIRQFISALHWQIEEVMKMSEIQIFENEQFGSIRTIEIDGMPWFVGKDVATALGYMKTENALAIRQ